MPTGYNPGNNSWGRAITAHQMAALIAVGAVVFLFMVERGFRGLKIDIG